MTVGLIIIVLGLVISGIIFLLNHLFQDRTRIENMELGKVFILFGGFLSIVSMQAQMSGDGIVLIGLPIIVIGFLVSLVSYFKK